MLPHHHQRLEMRVVKAEGNREGTCWENCRVYVEKFSFYEQVDVEVVELIDEGVFYFNLTLKGRFTKQIVRVVKKIMI